MRTSNFKKRLPRLALLALLTGLILCPLITVFAKAVIVDGRLGLYQAWQSIANAENIQTVCNSLLLGLCVVLCSTVIAVPTAYLLARTQLAKHSWLDIIFMVPFMTPPYIASMGWILFMQKRGLFQQLFPATGSWSEGSFCFGGLVLVMSLHVFPFLMTMLKNAMLNIPASLEESGAVFGAGFRMRLRKIFAPLLTGNYAIGALLVFVKTLSEYGTPYTLGRRIGFYVFTTDIHRYSTTAPIDFGRSASLSSILVCICMAMWLMQNYITSRTSYRLVGGKGSRPARTKLSAAGQIGAWLWAALVSAGGHRRAVFFHHLHLAHQAARLWTGRGQLHPRPLPGAPDHAQGAGLHLEEPLPRGLLRDHLLRDWHGGRGRRAQIQRASSRRRWRASACCPRCCPASSWSSASCCSGMQFIR